MCGIGGCVLAAGQRPQRALLERMGEILAHRGPDDAGVEIAGSVGLVHRRLSIVDPSPAGRQPMASPDGRWWITYNGEVFNHLELRGELTGVSWRGHSDTETLVHALGHWGSDAIARCNGLVAYAALDLDRRRLLLVLPLDGGRAMAAMAPAMWFLGLGLLVAVAFAFPDPIILIILLFGGMETYRRWRERKSRSIASAAYYRVRPRDRWLVAVVYLGLIAALAVGMDATHIARSVP